MSVTTTTEPTVTVPDATVTKITAAPARKRSPSAATKRANASASKPAAPKRTPAKSSKTPAKAPPAKKVAAPKSPSLRTQKAELGAGCIKVLADYASKVKVPDGMTREDIRTVIGGWASYLPGAFDDRLVMISAGGRRTV